MRNRVLVTLTLLMLVSLQGQDFNTTKVYLKVTNAGATLFGAPDKENLQIVRISPLISGFQNEVFDYLNDADSTEEAASTQSSPKFGNYHVKSIFDNSYSFAPPAYKVELNAYGWLNGAYTISHYQVTNIDSFTYQSKFGFEVLPYVDNIYGNELIQYNSAKDYITISRDTNETFIGLKILSSPLYSMKVIEWDTAYNVSDSLLYENLFSDSLSSQYQSGELGSVLFPSIETKSISPGSTYDVFIALAIGENFEQLDSNMTVAVSHYSDIGVTTVNEEIIPKSITLEQNYPNPFNPSTKIRFSLPENEFVELSIYNSIGQLVEKLISKEMSPGNHEIKFDAVNFASGVYFYYLKSESNILTKKMILLK